MNHVFPMKTNTGPATLMMGEYGSTKSYRKLRTKLPHPSASNAIAATNCLNRGAGTLLDIVNLSIGDMPLAVLLLSGRNELQKLREVRVCKLQSNRDRVPYCAAKYW